MGRGGPAQTDPPSQVFSCDVEPAIGAAAWAPLSTPTPVRGLMCEPCSLRERSPPLGYRPFLNGCVVCRPRVSPIRACMPGEPSAHARPFCPRHAARNLAGHTCRAAAGRSLRDGRVTPSPPPPSSPATSLSARTPPTPRGTPARLRRSWLPRAAAGSCRAGTRCRVR